jgi:hypothetical protein
MRTILLAIIASAGLVGSARAECRQEDETQPVTTRIEMIKGKPTMVIEKEIVVCGRPAKPAVAYVTNPKDVDYTWTQLTEDLASKIVESVKQLGARNGEQREPKRI